MLKRTTDPPKPVLPPVYVAAIIEEATIAENNGSAHQHHYSHAPLTQPLQSSGSAHNIRDLGLKAEQVEGGLHAGLCGLIRPHCHSQRSLDLETSPHGGGKQHKKLERMYSEDRVSSEIEVRRRSHH